MRISKMERFLLYDPGKVYDSELCANPETDGGLEPPDRPADRQGETGVQVPNSRFLEMHDQGASEEGMDEAIKSADGPFDYTGGSPDLSGPGDSFRESTVVHNLTGNGINSAGDGDYPLTGVDEPVYRNVFLETTIHRPVVRMFLPVDAPSLM